MKEWEKRARENWKTVRVSRAYFDLLNRMAKKRGTSLRVMIEQCIRVFLLNVDEEEK